MNGWQKAQKYLSEQLTVLLGRETPTLAGGSPMPAWTTSMAMAARAVGFMVVCLLLVCLFGAITNQVHLYARPLKLLTVPIIVFLYLVRKGEQAVSLYTPPSSTAVGWGLAGFFFSAVASHNWCNVGLCFGIISGLFVYIDPLALRNMLSKEGARVWMVVLGAFSGPLLLLLQKALWVPVSKFYLGLSVLWLSPSFSKVTILLSQELHKRSNPEGLELARSVGAVGRHFSHKGPVFLALINKNFFVKLTVVSNVFNGVFLLFFFMALLSLRGVAWFERVSWPAVALGGVAYNVLVGSALLAAFFALGHSSAVGNGWFLTDIAQALLQPRYDQLASWGGYIILESSYLAMIYAFVQYRQRASHA